MIIMKSLFGCILGKNKDPYIICPSWPKQKGTHNAGMAKMIADSVAEGLSEGKQLIVTDPKTDSKIMEKRKDR